MAEREEIDDLDALLLDSMFDPFKPEETPQQTATLEEALGLPSGSIPEVDVSTVKPFEIGVSDRDIARAAIPWRAAVEDHIWGQYPRGRSKELVQTELADREESLYQVGGKVVSARPTVSQIKGALEKYPSLREIAKYDNKMINILDAIDKGDEDFAQELIRNAPANSFLDEFTEPTGALSLLGRAARSRLIPIKPAGEPDPRKATWKNYTKTEARIRKQTQNGEKSIWEGIQDAWTGQTRMTEEDAKEAGLMRSEEENKSFWAPVEMWEGGPMVAGGLRDFLARTAIISGAAGALAPVFLEGQDLERFEKELRAANPSEIMEQAALVVRNARDRGDDEETIRKEFKNELNRSLLFYSYKDLPDEAKFDEPDLALATKFVKNNRSIAMQRELGQVSRFASMVLEGDEDKEDLQRMLNSVPFRELPEEVWKNTIPSTKEVINRTLDGIDYIIGAQDASGLPSTIDLEKDIGEALLKKTTIDGKVYLVEGNVSRWLSLLGGLTETVAEARLPLGSIIPITPADRDFYYNYGKRDPDSTWWTRLLTNIETREMGFTRHLTDEALWNGFDRGDWEYHAAAILGVGADLLVPWESGQFRIASAPVRTVYAGARTMKATRGLGYSASAFAAGAFPKLFQMQQKVAKRVTMASERLAKKFEGTPTAQDLKRFLDETGESALSYEETWLAEQALELMTRKKKPLTYEKAIDHLKSSAKAEVWENVAHITETFIREKMSHPEGADLYENLPPKLQGTIRRVLDQVADYRDVEQQLGLHFSERGRLHADLLDIMYKYGDPETAAIRTTEEYGDVAREVSKMVDDGLLDASDYPVVMGYIESQAIRSAIDTTAELSDFKVPRDYLRNVVVRRLESPGPDGSKWRIEARAPEGDGVGKNTIDALSLTSKQAEKMADFFRNGDVEDLFTAFEVDDVNSPLRLMMGDSWINTLYRQFDHTTEDIRNVGKRSRLTERGKGQLRDSLNTFFLKEGGAGKVGGVWRFYKDFQSRFGNYWMRIGAEGERIGTRVEARGKLNRMFEYERILNDDAVAIAARGRGYSTPRKVTVTTGEEGLRAGQVPAYGRRREFWEVDFNKENVRHALGITDDIEEIAADELFSRAVGYVVGEHFKRQLKVKEFERPTPRTILSKGRAVSVAKAVRARFVRVLGAAPSDLKSAKTGDYVLNEVQQARMRVFLRQIESEPLAKIIHERFFDVGADLSKITGTEFEAIKNAITDIESGVFSRATHYTMAIPESFGKSMFEVIQQFGDRAADSNKYVADYISKMRKAFVVPDELKHTLGPAQRQIIDRHLMRLERASRDIFEWARLAQTENKKITMDALMDQLRDKLHAPVDLNVVDDIVGTVVVNRPEVDGMFLPPVPAKDGYVTLLTEFTDAEKIRAKGFRAAEGDPFATPEEPAIFRGDAGGVAADKFAIEGVVEKEGLSLPVDTKVLSEAGSKIEFILKDTTIADMQRVIQGGGKLTVELEEAFFYLNLHKNKAGTALNHDARVAMGKALEIIRDTMISRQEQIVTRGRQLLIAFAGSPGAAILTNLEPRVAARVYKLFYTGGDSWIELLKYLQDAKALEIGLETIGGSGKSVRGRTRIPRYRITEAFMGALVRMRAMEVLNDMADDMVRYGMPGDIQKFSKPRPILNHFGNVIASPIDSESNFWKRVRFYVEQELNFSMTRVEERAYKRDMAGKPELDAEGKPIVSDTRIIEPQAPGRELWGEEGPDYAAVKGGTMSNPHDFAAYSRAQQIIAQYGHRYRPEKFVEYTFPSGQTGLVPSQLVSQIDSALERAATIGTARVGSLPEISANRLGSPVSIDPKHHTLIKAEASIGRFMEFLWEKSPLTLQMTKMGVTTGIFVPNPAYFFGVGMGGGLQLYQGVGPVAAARMTFKNNGMVAAVMARMWKDGEYAPGNPLLISKNGLAYTADEVTELAQMYGLKSSFILAEAPQSLAKSMNRLRAKGINKVYWSAAEWQRSLVESATAMDNYYRVSVFTDALQRGKSPAAAAKLARKVAFDYADLTDVEKSLFRNVFMFYSYLRKNMDLFWDTLLTNPERIIGQMRAMKGIHNAYIEEDTEVRLFERDYAKTRLAVGFRNAAVKNHTTDRWMYMTPPMPAYDAAGFVAEIVNAIAGDEESQRYMIGQINPWLQAPFVLTLEKDIFYNKDINQYNPVPPWLVHLDQTILGNTLTEGFGIVEAPQIDLSRRYIEGDEYAGSYMAQEGRWWWVWKNILQVPGTGRSMDTLSYLDRANLGPMELLAKIARMMHEEGAEGGAWSYSTKLSRVEKDTLGPRSGLTELDEFLGLLGIKAFPVPTSEAAHQRILDEVVEKIGRERADAERTSEERVIKRRITPRK